MNSTKLIKTSEKLKTSEAGILLNAFSNKESEILPWQLALYQWNSIILP
jgi:hypothetical protein